MPTVLITRPRAASEKLAQKLEQYGFGSVIEPLLEIEALENPMPDIALVQAIMITSANALDACEDALDLLLDLPCFCVGAKTAERAREAGFRNVQNSDGDGADLARLIGGTLNNNAKAVLYIAAREADSKAQTELERLGYKLIVWHAYAAKQVLKLSALAVRYFEQQKLDAVVVFSVRTAEALRAILARHRLEACCESLSAIGLSRAVADALRLLPWRAIMAAPTPTEDAVIECLKRLHP